MKVLDESQEIDILESLEASHVTLKYGGAPVDLTIKYSDFHINPATIDQDIGTLPGHIAFWSAVYATAAAHVDRYKTLLDEVSADIDLKIRAEADQTGERITENKIKAKITFHESVIEAQMRLHQAKWIANQVRAKLNAFETKLKSALDLAATFRSERKSTTFVAE